MTCTQERVDTARRAPLAVGLLVAVPITLIILWTLGALTETTEPGMPVTPWATLWSLPLDRLVRDVAASLTLGFAAVGGVLLRRPDGRLLRAASLSALVWLVALLAQVILTVSELLARPLPDSADPTIVRSLLTQTVLGQSLVAQIVLVTLIAVLAWAVLGRVTAWVVMVMTIVAAVLPALSGHGGLHGGHTAASISLGVHLLAIGLWLGGLVATCVYVGRGGSDSAVAVRRFSVLALVCVIVLAESGLLNASLRVDGYASLVTTPYGTLILGKATVLIALIVFGWRQRTRVVPIADGPFGRSLLARFAAYEFLLFGVALGLSVALSRTAPPAGAVAGQAMTFGALTVLALGLPVVLVWAGWRMPTFLRVARSYPDPFAVLLVVVACGVTFLLPSGLLGADVGAALGTLVLVAVGLVFAWGVLSPRGWPAVVIAMVGWALLAAWAIIKDAAEGPGSVIVAGGAAEIILAILLVLSLRTRDEVMT